MSGLVVAIFIKGLHKSVIESFDDIVPFWIVGGGGVIKDTRVPFITASKSHRAIHSIPYRYEACILRYWRPLIMSRGSRNLR
jgi:hypothetical protein